MPEPITLRLSLAARYVAAAGLFLLLVATPLVWSPSAGASFVTPKLLVFYPAVVLLGIASTLRSGYLRLDWGDALLLGLLAVLAASVASSPNPVTSAFGGYNRASGGLLLLASVVLALVARRLDLCEARASLYLLLSSALALTALLFIQRHGLMQSVIPFGQSSYDHPGATLGNPNYAAGFLAAAVPVALTPLLLRTPGRRLVKGFLFAASYAVLVGGLLLAGSRGGFLSLATSAAAAIFLFLARRTRQRTRTLALLLVAGAALVAALVAPWLANSGLGGRLNPVAGDASLSQRWGLMKVAAHAMEQRPLLGWGPGNFQEAWQLNADNQTLSAEPGSWLTDAHNIFAEVGTVGGVVSLAILLALLVLVARRLSLIVDSAAGPTAFLVAGSLLLTLSLNPQNLPLTPLLFFFLGLCLPVRGVEQETSSPVAAIPLGSGRLMLLIVLSGALFLTIVWSIGALRADDRYAAALVRADGAGALNAAHSLRSYSLPFFTAGRLLTGAGASLAGRELAVEAYRSGLSLDPRNAYGLQSLAAACLLAGNPAQAVETADKAVRAMPKNVRARLVKANALVALGRSQEVPALVDEALAGGVSEPALFVIAAQILERAGDHAKALDVLRSGILAYPSDTTLQSTFQQLGALGN